MGISAIVIAFSSLLLGAGITLLITQSWHNQASRAKERVEELTAETERLKKEINKGIFDILALYEFTTVLGSISNLHELYNMMVDTMLRIIKYDACALMLIEPDKNHLEIAVARGFSPGELSKLAELNPGCGLIGQVIESGQPQIINDSSSWESIDHIHQQLSFGSLLSIPFIVHGEVLGALNLYLREKQGFNQDDLRILFIIANQAAFAIKNGQLYNKVAEQATQDGLTGLYNHRVFREKIEEAVTEAKVNKTSVSMIMADVDEFKAVNDCYGHQRGDEVLKEIAKLLKKSVRETDIVSRYGGEEFAVIMPNTPKTEALAVARRIHNAVASHDFNGLKITVSVGLATYPSTGVASTDELISAADERAYQAKANGKNQICYQAS